MKKVIIITGTGRSGTSWIHDVATSHYNYRRIFEPLHPGQVPSVAEFAGLYLVENDDNPKLMNYMSNVFYKKTDDSWITWMHLGITKDTKLFRKILQFGYNLPNVKFWASNRVVKFIQANLMISWLAENFNHPIVFVIREPYSVIRSQLNMGWGNKLNVYTDQEKVQKALLDTEMLNYLDTLSTVIERLTARWCIENLIAIEAINKLKNTDKAIIAITYEKLIKDGNIYKLLENLGYSEIEISIIKKQCAIRDRVRSSRRKSTKGAGLSEEQISKIKNVLCKFGVESYVELTTPFDKIFSD